MPTTSPTDTSVQRRQEAIERLEKRTGFWQHLIAYTLINGLIIGAWFVIAGGGLFWPIFPLFGWGIGLVFHAMEAFRRPYTEERIQREIDRMT
jgi:uncharacterized membrane protein